MKQFYHFGFFLSIKNSKIVLIQEEKYMVFDDLREINRISGTAIELFASKRNLAEIRSRFGYLIADDKDKIDPVYRAALHPNIFEYNHKTIDEDADTIKINAKLYSNEKSPVIKTYNQLEEIKELQAISVKEIFE